MSGDVVLARIDSGRFYDRPETYRQEVRAWLTANGIDYNRVLCSRDVEVVVIDGPAIVREERVDDGSVFSRVVHSLLRVPLPEHLTDPS